MLTQEQVATFRRDGFINGGAALSESAVDALRADLERVIAEKDKPSDRKPVLLRNLGGKEENPVWQVVNMWQASDEFCSAMRHPKILEDIAQLSGAQELRIWHDQIQYKPAQTGGANIWHQDSPLWPVLWPQTQISAWIALDDVDEENGCMSMVPGSHLWGSQLPLMMTIKKLSDLPQTFEGKDVPRVLCPVKKGCVHYHHGLTWHSSHENTSGRPRRAIAFHYMTEETTFKASGEHCMKPYIKVADGEKITGETFPCIWAKS